MSDNDETAARLKAARKRAGLSQRAAAERLGVHYTSLNRYEQGGMRVPADLLAKAEALSPDRPAPPPPAEVPTVAIPLHQLTYWRGVLETEYRHLGGLSRSMEAMLSMLNDATRGIGGFIDSGVLPRPIPPLPMHRIDSSDDDAEGERKTG